MMFLNWFLPVLLMSVPAWCLNLALNKTSASSDVQWGGVPERGNDGNANTDYWQHSCILAMVTVADPNPWWQVDLEADYYIYSVAITNRADNLVWRLANFTVEVYKLDPNTTGAVGQGCAEHPEGVGAGVRLELLCEPGVRGRYVRIQKTYMKEDDGLNFCEAEVFGTLTLEKGRRMPGTPLSQESGTAAECGRICSSAPLCDGFNFDGGFGGGTGTCQFMFQREAAVLDANFDCYTSF